ncbi:MAG: ribosomal-processing cysteine protease Prp [Ruminococcaceae bacterium]|nr:ribosomal-processing cysteine protease Prp [Oscillospiraceae bacterium]
MIFAKFDTRSDGSIRLVMKGHAGAAPKGEDLVCAGATTLAYTAAQAVLTLQEQGKLTRKPKMALSEGNALIIATPTQEGRQELEQAIGVVGLGLEMLSHNYPHCIRLENTM